MTKSSRVTPDNDDIDLTSLGRALWRAKGWILGLALGAGVVTFIALSMMRPLYTSEARILIQNEETAFTRPTSEQGNNNYRTTLDEQAVQSQVQVLTSRDLILKVVRELDLTQNETFMKDAGETIVGRLMKAMGLSHGTPESEEERAANALAEHLDVYQLSKSSVIALEYTSGDPELAAKIANTLADTYIGWQRTEKIDQTKDATAWLDAQIKALRTATAEAEEAVETFRASKGLYSGSNDVTLNAQQLSEINSQLILAEAQESEARARAKLIKKMLASNGDIDATPEVMSSQVVINLIEQRVLVQRQLAELSATLLPSHPRIQQLRSELADVRAQIRIEAQKVVKALENQAEVAVARESSLRASLDAAKNRSAGQSDSEVKLRALEREAKANRDLLESYLARYRDASMRHDVGAVPAQAAIVSRAHASVLPSFPRKGPITLLVMAATALLAIGSVLAKAIIVGGGPDRRDVSRGAYDPDELVPSEPEYMSRAEMLALSQMNAAERRDRRARPVLERRQEPRRQAIAEAPPEARNVSSPAAEERRGRELPAPAAETAPPETTDRPAEKPPAAKPETPPAATSAPEQAAQAPVRPAAGTTPAARTRPASKSVWRPSKPAKRPSWLQVNEPRSAELGEQDVKPAPAAEAKATASEPPEETKSTEQAKPASAEPPVKAEPAVQANATEPAKPSDAETATVTDETPKKTETPAPERAPETAATPEVAEAPVETTVAEQPETETTAPAPAKKSAGALATLASLAAMEKAAEARAAKTQAPAPARPTRTEVADTRASAATAEEAAPKQAQASLEPRAETMETRPVPESSQDAVARRSTADFIQRLRKDATASSNAGTQNDAETPPSRSTGFLSRFRGKKSDETAEASPPEKAARDIEDSHREKAMAALSPNDLRHYLTQRVAASEKDEDLAVLAMPSIGMGDVGPVLGSLDAVLDTVLKSATGGLPRTLLIAGTSARAQSPAAAIAIARNLAERNEQVALVDLAMGSAVISGQLSMPRVPGFSDLSSGKAEFTDVVRVDDTSPLQVIPAGNPAAREGYDDPDRFMRVFEALTQAYDCVVLHADMASVESLMPALKFELPVAVAVLPGNGSPEKESLALATIQRLGCPVVVYEPGGDRKKRRFSLFGRKVAV